ncbi:fatty acyl-CoA synthetase [Kitasatospora sp. NBC_01287]|uniref:fatty acyl-CoA synthetase n=1 Tax=Kitasatospora sp. NBC_01287 TaxID=2903573 RepID=UPI002250D95D|nr:fatty acyl-CoA synthetase [Kitasatospora sp. NBC_01287]MCX4749960.1 fatty acyl-CoA synthetase [Kitasatospora sp. NBC_01287]
MELTHASTVPDILRRSAARVPDRVALHFADRHWTYRELDDAVTRAAGWLLARGLRPGDRVAALGRNSDTYLILFLACGRAGLVHVPVNYNATQDELRYFTSQSGSSLLLHDTEYAPAAAALAPLPAADLAELHAAASAGPVPVLEVQVRDTDLVQLLYTSGTTAAPKGAMMTHRALLHEYLSAVVALDLTERDRPLHALPLYHSGQLHVFLLPYLLLGAENHLLAAPDPAELLARLERHRLTSFFAPPTVWTAIAAHPDFAAAGLGALAKAYYGASIMPAPVLARLREALPGTGFYNAFGQSEVGPLTTVLRPEEHVERPHSAGRPVLFVEVKVVDEAGAEVGPDQVGEVLYRSPQLCTGYWDKPEESAAAFEGDWFHSGDLVRRDAAGYLYVVDRLKDVINTGGVLVASREVEDVLYAHPAVAEAAVIGTPHPRWIEAVTAVVVLREPVGAAELIAWVRERLPAYKTPKAVHFAPALPKNASGKLLKRELRERLTGSAAGWQD